MSYVFLVCILALQAEVVVVSQQQQTCSGRQCHTNSECSANEQCLESPCGFSICTAVQTLACATVPCKINTACRYVVECSTCPVQPRCIPVGEIYGGVDNECRFMNYTEVILIKNPGKESSYSQLGCPEYQSCPRGSDCAGGLCCRGKLEVPLEKYGLCPKDKVPPQYRGQPCVNDYECPGKQKCCTPRQICLDPVFVQNQVLCAIPCNKGEVCVLRPPFCPIGRLCMQAALIPKCVPYQCANCDFNEHCVLTTEGYTCSKTDRCGGCPRRKVCKFTPKQCVTTPCPQYECVPIDRCRGCEQQTPAS